MTRRLSAVLADLGLASPAVDAAISDFYSSRHLGEYLVSQGLLSREQLEVALIRQQHNGRRLTADAIRRLEELWTNSHARRVAACATLTLGVPHV